MEIHNYDLANPNPEYLIKSIAEQGYSIETAISDLIDNSIFADADKIEVLSDTSSTPFKLYITDNGNGMDSESLSKNMHFPSNSPDSERSKSDLGRFGLGMKTASFSQTRCFTVLSRKRGEEKYYARTWDVEYLRTTREWRIIVNSDIEIAKHLENYNVLSNNYIGGYENFSPNTIVIWQGLYKFENYLSENKKIESFNRQITNISNSYLSIVFHRFLENNKLKIRINNTQISAFNPIPENKGIRSLAPLVKTIKDGSIKITGFVLPNKAITESRENSEWTPYGKSLMDMEGLYVYRMNRLIFFGSWNDTTNRTPRLQLARLVIEIGNDADKIFHLNVAKSQINIPYDMVQDFENIVTELKKEAVKEYYNASVQSFKHKSEAEKSSLYLKESTNKGIKLYINKEFPLLTDLVNSLDEEQKISFDIILNYTTNLLNTIRNVDGENVKLIEVEKLDEKKKQELSTQITKLKSLGYTSKQIVDLLLPKSGIKISELPDEIKSQL
jgi:hypothetical protein